MIFLDTKNPLYVNGDSTTTNWNITNCTITNNGPLGIKPVFGVVLFNVNNYTIDHNLITNVLKTTNDLISAQGISIRGTSSTGLITNNVIYKVENQVANNGSYSGGIIIFPAGGGTGGVTIYNNMISDITNVSNTDDNPYNFPNKGHGIIIRGSNTAPIGNAGVVNIWHNTILINSTKPGGRNSCLYIEESSGATLDVRNNIFTNRSTNGTQYSILISGSSSPSITRMNNNSHFVSSVTGNFRARKDNVEYLNTTTFHAVSNDPQSNNSNVLDPAYFSDGDLHLQKITTPNSLLTAANTIIPEVTNDIDGDSRTRPYRGADEAFICFEDAIWNGLSWTNTPKADSNLTFNGDYNDNIDVLGCNCKVNSTATVTIPIGKTITIKENVTVDPGGSLIFENGASLVQIDDIQNSGNIIYKRTTSEVQNLDYVYWSSPVKDQIVKDLSPASTKFHTWFVSNWAIATPTSTMKPAKGYIIQVPDNLGGSTQNVEFEGVPNNGTIAIQSQGANKKNLIGNPYPSAIDAEQFMIDNEDIIGSALYFWTHKTAQQAVGTGNVYVYSSNDYASFNLTGTTITTTGSLSGSEPPTGDIPAGQSFFVVSKTLGNFTFNNDLRIGDSNRNTQFYKQSKTKKTTAVEKNRIWLNMTNDGGAFKQLLLGYIEGATNGDDNLYDGTTINGNTFIDFYSIANEKNYTIQGRSLPFDNEDVIPLGYKTTIEGTFKISIDKVDGAFKNQEVFLEDKLTNTIHNLNKGSYSFTTAIGTFGDRFVLRYTDSTTSLGTEDNQSITKGIIVSVKNSKIKVNSFDEKLTAIKIYDLKGSLLYEKNKLNTNEFTVDHFASSTQIMIVMANLETGKWVSEEIIFY